MHPPLISIVTVTKNCGGTLARTLRSLKSIKATDIEYIIVDGVSTDDTLSVIEQFPGLVDQLISEPDTGIYNAMNKGLALTKGDYVLFINGDDELMPNGFAHVKSVLRNGNIDVLCATTLVDSVESPAEILIPQPWRLLFYNAIPHPSAFVASALLKKYRFREDLRIASDYDLFLRLFMDRRRFVKLDVATALHRRGGASGNISLSELEVDRVKRERLRWFYPLVATAKSLHRWLKIILMVISNGKR